MKCSICGEASRTRRCPECNYEAKTMRTEAGTMAEKKQSREGKVYERKNSATRAAKEDGHAEGAFVVEEHEKGFRYILKKNVKMREQFEKSDEKIRNEEKKIADKSSPVGPRSRPKHPSVPCPHCSLELKDDAAVQSHINKRHPSAEFEPTREVKPLKLETYKDDPKPQVTESVATVVPLPPLPDYVPSATSTGPSSTKAAPRVTKQVPESEKPKKDRLHRSHIESPTKAVWHVADEMFAKNPQITRKQVIEECTKRGIAFFTARTQFQQWLTARRESEASSKQTNKK